ncbi:rhp16 [Symbiodinium sp. CCMP2592]|nr:rhp16 [Symbiodinium sp. CCMP2592]
MGESAGHGQEVQEAAEAHDGSEGALEGANIASDSQARIDPLMAVCFYYRLSLPRQAKPQGSPGKLGQVRAFKRKLEDRSGRSLSGRESLRAGIIDSGEGRDGRVKRKAAAVADERLKAQIAMERGVRERAPKAQARPQPQDEEVQAKPSEAKKGKGKGGKDGKGKGRGRGGRGQKSRSGEERASGSRTSAKPPVVASNEDVSPATATEVPSTDPKTGPVPTASVGADDAMQGLVTLAGGANRLPERLSNCAFDTGGQEWVPRGRVGQVPKVRRPYLLYGYTHKAEKSKTGMAACKRCGDKIPKSALRIGYPVKDQRGEYGAIVNWFHMACARHDDMAVAYAKMGDTKMSKTILGYADMPVDMRQDFRAELMKPKEEMGSFRGLLHPRTVGKPTHHSHSQITRRWTWVQLDLASKASLEVEAQETEPPPEPQPEAPPAEQAPRKLPQHPAPKALTRSMLAFQSEGLGWMLEREADETTRGGILADEMGMGKTLQTIALILAGEIKGATLVVCPAAAMLQWRNEILRFTAPGSLEVRLYYGLDKKSVLDDLMDETVYLRRTVVLTTYQTLESDYRQQVNRTKVQCQWCGRLFQKQKLFYHQKYFCGPDAQRTEKQMKSQRKADFKDEAVKKMKIGGTETNIVLNPLNAIRSAATQALRRRAKSSGAMPFPVSVLPDEAQAALRGAGESSPQAGAPATPAKRRRGKGPGADADAACRNSSPSSTPAPVSMPRHGNRSGNTGTGSDDASRVGWGATLNGKRSTKVIELTQSDDSDIELLHEEGAQRNGLAFGSASASKPKKGKSAEVEANTEAIEPPPPPPPPPPPADAADIDLSRSALYKTVWGRVVLDEAHRIKTRTNSTAQAAFALRVRGSRWCLSGTPLQNRVGEFWSIIRFIQFYPYAHYFCTRKGCKCCSLHYRFDIETSLCKKCGHTKMQHRSHFTTEVSNPIKKFGFLGAGKVAMEKLRTEVLDRILLRRTKVERAADVQSEAEISLHRGIQPTELVSWCVEDSGSVSKMPSKSHGIAEVCALCQDDIEDRRQQATASCGHCFHKDCLKEYLEQAPQLPSGGVGCPTCFVPMTWADPEAQAGARRVRRASRCLWAFFTCQEDQDQEEDDVIPEDFEAPAKDVEPPAKGRRKGIMQKIKTADFQSSTKIEALLQEIQKMQAADPSSKALVFSQFTRFLELIEWRLKREGISAATVLGSMPIVSRNNIIVSFQTEPSLKVLLISLKAGGEGLNLQAADHIFLMDPWWNPAAEAQAIQRAHRIGQTRPVKATRFVAANTIEEKIIELQEKKQTVFDCTVGNSNQALQRLTAEDIQFLFSSS